MAPTSCFTGQVHRLPDAPEAYGAMITRAKAAPPQSRSTALRTNTAALPNFRHPTADLGINWRPHIVPPKPPGKRISLPTTHRGPPSSILDSQQKFLRPIPDTC